MPILQTSELLHFEANTSTSATELNVNEDLPPYLDADSLYAIFNQVVAMSPIHQAVVLRVIFSIFFDIS